MTKLRVEIVTPLRTCLEAEVDEVIAPLPDGWIGVLAGHVPFQARLVPGVVMVRAGEATRQIATQGGTVVVEPDRVLVLTGAAMADATLEQLEHEIGTEATQLAEVEAEAERHLDRVYQQLARATRRRR